MSATARGNGRDRVADATSRAVAAGSREAVERGGALLETAARLGPASDGRRTALRAARRMYIREARRAHARARRLGGAEAESLERVAVEFLARSLAVDDTAPADGRANGAEAAAAVAVVIAVTVSPGDRRLDVTHGPVVGAVSYRITATEFGATTPAITVTKQAAIPPTAATLTPLTNGTVYTVRVDALDAIGAVLGSGEASGTPASPLAVTVTPGDRRLTVAWSLSGTHPVASYRVTATAVGATTPAASVVTAANVFTATLSNLVNGTTYMVRVEARDAGGVPLAQAQGSGTPSSPLSVTAVPGDSRITATYALTAPLVPPASSYRFTARPTGTTTPVATVVRLSTDPPTAVLSGLANETEHTVVVEALDGSNAVLTRAEAVATPSSPLVVTAIPGDRKITAVYALTGPILPAPASFRFTATPTGSSTPAATVIRQPGDAPTAPLTNLTNGTVYRVAVEALDGNGGRITRDETTATPVGSTPVALAPLDLHPLTVARPDLVRLRRVLADATRVGATWRYDYLKAQALAAAEHASVFEEQIAELMALDVAKTAAAEQLLGPYLLGVTANLQALLAKVTSLPRPDVSAPATALADAINTYVLLERLLAWLSRNDALQFWIGLFGRLIDDVAAFDTKLTRTRRYVREQIATAGVSGAVTAMAADARAQVAAMVDELGAPLRAAIGDSIGATAAGMQAVFDSFDEPLLVNTGAADPAGVASGNPLGTLSNQLMKAVDDLLADLKAEVEQQLDLSVNPGGASAVFEAIVITYVVLPILAALVISLVGGPISAALLAAAVTLAAQELLHLVAQWLGGPLLGQLERARGDVDEAIAGLREMLAAALPARLGATTDPAAEAKALAGQLGALRELVPKAFLDESAALLEEARDGVLRTATNMALAAEQALGLESGTTFDEIDLEYVSELPPAPELPGGLGAGRFATAALVRDLARLEQTRVGLLDGKEIETTLRLSLFRELGGAGDPANPNAPDFVSGQLARLLGGEEVAVHLREDALLDRAHPGLYRVLISEIRALGIFDRRPIGDLGTVNVPVHVTHLGESRTRVRKDANLAPAESADKWGSTFLETDRDPAVASLGFVTLVRLQEPESAAFNLFPTDAPTLATATAGDGGTAAELPPRAQYRPFENRGLEGTLLLRLPTAESAAAVLGETRDTLLSGAGDPRLVDVVLDVTVRACYDADLAAAIRAQREQRASALELSGAAVGGAARLVLAPRLPAPERGSRTTVHFSLRGHRDQTLAVWQAILGPYSAARGGLPTGGADWAKVGGTKQLAAAEPFNPLPLLPASAAQQTSMPRFTLAFAPTVETPTVPAGGEGAALAGLARRLVVTPETLGVAADLVGATASGAGLVGISVSVVPTKAGASTLGVVSRGSPTPWLPGNVADVALANAGRELQVGVVGGTARRFFHANRTPLGWNAFVQPLPTHPNPLQALAFASLAGRLHAFAVDGVTRKILHSTREAVWSPWAPVNGAQPPTFSEVAAAEVAGELQLCGIQNTPSTDIMHAKRASDGTWTPFGSVFTVVGALPGFLFAVDCAELDGELWLFATTFHPTIFQLRGHWLTIRHADGTWTPWQQLSFGPILPSVSAAAVGGELDLCVVLQSDVWWSRRRKDGTWVGENVSTKAGKPGTFVRCSCVELAGELVLSGMTNDGRFWLTTRHADGSWDPYVDAALDIDKEVRVGDPLANLKMVARGPLTTLLPAFATATTPSGRLTVSPFAPGAEPTVPLSTLFDTGNAAELELDIDDPVAKGLLHDVILSLTYTVPVETVTPSA